MANKLGQFQVCSSGCCGGSQVEVCTDCIPDNPSQVVATSDDWQNEDCLNCDIWLSKTLNKLSNCYYRSAIPFQARPSCDNTQCPGYSTDLEEMHFQVSVVDGKCRYTLSVLYRCNIGGSNYKHIWYVFAATFNSPQSPPITLPFTGRSGGPPYPCSEPASVEVDWAT